MFKERKIGLEVFVKSFWLNNGAEQKDLKVIIKNRPASIDPSDPNNLDPDIEYLKDMNHFSNIPDSELQAIGKQIANQIMNDIASKYGTTIDTTKLVDVTIRKWKAPQN